MTNLADSNLLRILRVAILNRFPLQSLLAKIGDQACFEVQSLSLSAMFWTSPKAFELDFCFFQQFFGHFGLPFQSLS